MTVYIDLTTGFKTGSIERARAHAAVRAKTTSSNGIGWSQIHILVREDPVRWNWKTRHCGFVLYDDGKLIWLARNKGDSRIINASGAVTRKLTPREKEEYFNVF